MSKELVKFKKSYEDFVKYQKELGEELFKSHPNLVLQISKGSCNFSESPWVTLDNKTLAGFKALAIYEKIGKKLLSIVFPGVNLEQENDEEVLIKILSSPPKLNPQQISEALDSIKEIAADTLHETINNRTGAEIVLDFLKSCVNFLITIVTFGHKQNFFKSNTSQLERIKQGKQDLHNIFDTLSEEDKIVELV